MDESLGIGRDADGGAFGRFGFQDVRCASHTHLYIILQLRTDKNPWSSAAPLHAVLAATWVAVGALMAAVDGYAIRPW